MAEAIQGPREALSKHAPSIGQIQIDTEKIGMIIGKGGETIRSLSEEFDAQIDIDDDGTIRVYAANGELVEACIKRIQSMTKEVEVGDEFDGKIVKTTTFGAFVELTKGTDGLLHISNVKPGERVDSVDDVLTSGEEIDVTVVEVDRERGRIGLRLRPTTPRSPASRPRSSPRAPATGAEPWRRRGDRGREGRDNGGTRPRSGGDRGGDRDQ